MAFIINFILLLGVTVLVIKMLLSAHKIKKQLLSYPETIREKLLQDIKLAIALNYVSSITLLISFIFLRSNLFYFIVVFTAFLSIVSYEILENYKEEKQ